MIFLKMWNSKKHMWSKN